MESSRINNIKEKIKEIKIFLNEFEEKLETAPEDFTEEIEDIERLYRLKGLSQEIQTVLFLIQHGESKIVEFKQTLRYDIAQKGIKEKILEDAVLKNVNAFLNSDGGMLFIGVDDTGKIVGIEDELYHLGWNLDKYFSHLTNLFKERIDIEFFPFIEYKYFVIEGKKIIKIDCKRARKPCFLDNETFYIRANPAAIKLEGPKLLGYIFHHFGIFDKDGIIPNYIE